MGLLILFAGLAGYGIARSPWVAREFALGGVPVLLSLVGLGLSAIGIVQWAYQQPVVSTEGNTNYSGALAGMLIAALVGCAGGGPRRRLCLLSASALVVLLLLTRSRGGWAGAVAGSVVALWGLARGGRRVALLASGAAVVLGLLPLTLQVRHQASEARSSAIRVRLELWKGAARMLASHPWLGVGAGNFSVEYPPVRSAEEFRLSHQYAGSGFVEAEDAHSSWVQTAVETGPAGLTLFALIALVAARLGLPHRRLHEE
jgi:O-antigen ligase